MLCEQDHKTALRNVGVAAITENLAGLHALEIALRNRMLLGNTSKSIIMHKDKYAAVHQETDVEHVPAELNCV